MARKILTGVSILIMVYDAVSYLHSYYTDNAFDNKYINRNVRHVWESKKHPAILPLRKWEKNEGYKSSSEFLVKRNEMKRLVRRTFPTVVFTLGALVLILADYLLARVVLSMKDEEDVAISLGGIEDGLAKAVKSIIRYFHDTTRLCGVNPAVTSNNSYILIGAFLIVALMSCLFEVLISRLRSRMCNLFYTDRAHERADYLHFRITAGRVNRRTHLMLTIKSNIEKRRRIVWFSPWARLVKCLSSKLRCCGGGRSTLECPGCGWRVKLSESINVKFTLGSSESKCNICLDCHKDFRPVSFHPSSQYFSESRDVSENFFGLVTTDDEIADEVYRSV